MNNKNSLNYNILTIHHTLTLTMVIVHLIMVIAITLVEVEEVIHIQEEVAIPTLTSEFVK